MDLADVSVACLHVQCNRRVVVRPPPQADAEGFNSGQFGWSSSDSCIECATLRPPGKTTSSILTTLGFTQGVAGPTLFYDVATAVVIDLDVDDLHDTGPQLAMDILFSELDKHLLIKVSSHPGIESGYRYLRARRILPDKHREDARRPFHAGLQERLHSVGQSSRAVQPP